MNVAEVKEAAVLLQLREKVAGALRHLDVGGGVPEIVINGLRVCGPGRRPPVEVMAAIRMQLAADVASFDAQLAEIGMTEALADA